MSKSFAFFVCVALLAAPCARAAEYDSEHPFHAGIFAGATRASGDDAFTVGVDFEYKLSGRLGGALFYEAVMSDQTHHIVGVVAVIRPTRALKLMVGPGQEFSHGHSIWLLRTGVGYEMHIGAFSVSPSVALDLLAGGHKAIVYGMTIGLGF